jgi:CspA family cold shock protein
MEQGKIKWFNTEKGYGFIQPDNGSGDVFVHISEIEKAGYNSLNTNQVVSYELEIRNGKSSAVNLKLI